MKSLLIPNSAARVHSFLQPQRLKFQITFPRTISPNFRAIPFFQIHSTTFKFTPNFELDKSPTSFFFHIDPCSPHPFEFRLILPPLQYSLLGIITKLNTPPHQNAHMSISLRSKFLKYVFSSVKIFKTHFREASLLVINRHKMTIHSPRLHLTKSRH